MSLHQGERDRVLKASENNKVCSSRSTFKTLKATSVGIQVGYRFWTWMVTLNKHVTVLNIISCSVSMPFTLLSTIFRELYVTISILWHSSSTPLHLKKFFQIFISTQTNKNTDSIHFSKEINLAVYQDWVSTWYSMNAEVHPVTLKIHIQPKLKNTACLNVL